MNQINIGREIRFSLLGIFAGTAILAIGEMILSPLPEKKSLSPQSFPKQISLSGWQSSSGNLPQHFNKNLLQTIPGKSYQYTQADSLVNVQMHYLADVHDVKKLLQQYTSIPHQSMQIVSKEDIGFYGVLVHQDKLHLSACITPQGGSIVNHAHLYQRYPAIQGLSERLVFWLLGEKPLVEKVCLWSHLSISVSDSSPETASLTLEKFWFSWYQWWHPFLVTMVNKE